MAVEQHLRAAFGDVRELRDGDAEEVGSERDGLAVEVARGVGEALITAIISRPVLAETDIPRLARIGEEQRIVGGRIELALGDR